MKELNTYTAEFQELVHIGGIDDDIGEYVVRKQIVPATSRDKVKKYIATAYPSSRKIKVKLIERDILSGYRRGR